MAPDEETRKILKIGEASYAVTLPKKWCRELGIDVGDFVRLEKHEDSIVLRSPRRKEQESRFNLRIALDAFRRNTKQVVEEVIGAYIEGVSEIHLKGKPEVVEEAIRILRRKLPGIVVLPGLKEFSYKLMFMEASVDATSIIEKLSNTIKQMFDTVYSMFGSPSESVLEKLRDLEEEVEGAYYLGLRVSKKKLSEKTEAGQEVIDSIIVLRDLKDVADSLARLSVWAGSQERDSGVVLTRETAKVVEYLKELYEASISSYLRNDINRALTVLGKEEAIIEYIEELVKKLKKQISVFTEEILPIMRNTMDIARLTVSKCIRDKACRCRFFPLLE